MNCPKCNTAVKDGMKFCPKCGTKIESSYSDSSSTPIYRATSVTPQMSNNGEMKALVCPHCGANTTNTQNCEYCGSLLVRFVDKGIDISNTSYISGKCEYPGLLTELKNNLKLQKEQTHFVCTDIYWPAYDGGRASLCIGRSGLFNWADGSPIRLGDKSGGLIVVFGFDSYTDSAFSDFNRKMDNELQKFKALKSFPLFTSHTCSFTDQDGESRFGREYAIDFGKDAEGAASLISEVMSQVYGLQPTGNIDIFTNAGVDKVKQARNAWDAAHGIGTNDSALNDGCAGVFLIGIILVGTAISALL